MVFKVPLSRLLGILFSLLVLLPGRSAATHAMGVDLSYECLGNDDYLFTVNTYRDCAGISPPSQLDLIFNSPSTCGNNFTVSLSRIPGTGIEVSPLCPAQLPFSTCGSGNLPGVQQWIYEGIIHVPQNCSDWNISWDHCCRNNMITNLSTPGSQGIFVFTELNNTLPDCNNSPIFSSLPVPYICANEPFCYNHGALDPDGDSLVYRMVNALNGPYPGLNIPYTLPHSPTYPMTDVNGSITFDSLTGSFCVTPNGPQVAVVSIQVEEYRNGQLIGTTMRDLQIVVQACNNQPPIQSPGGIFNVSNGVRTDSMRVLTCPGNTLSFDIGYEDPNLGDNVTVQSNLSQAIPGATINTLGSNPVLARISWTPTLADTGSHYFTVTLGDEVCPVQGMQVYGYEIRVQALTYAGPDQTYCINGIPAQLNAGGGSTFTWNTLSGDPGGLSCTNCRAPFAAPNQNSTYEVVSDLIGCKNRDTVNVTLVPNFSLVVTPEEDTLCQNAFLQLDAAVTGTASSFTYAWSPAATLSNPSIPSPLATPLASTDYVVSVTSSDGCVILDTSRITLSGLGPNVQIMPKDTAICAGDTIQLTTTVDKEPRFCGPTPIPCTGSNVDITVGNGPNNSQTIGPFNNSVNPTFSFRMRHQFLYTAAELQAAGWTHGGSITHLGLNLATANTDTMRNFRIKITCTTDTFFADDFFVHGAYEVFGPRDVEVGTSTGFNSFQLDTPYDWDGSSNLIVEFCSDGADTSSTVPGNSVFYTLTSGVVRCLEHYNRDGGGCAQIRADRRTIRPDIRFTVCQEVLGSPLVYQWSGGSSLSSTSATDPLSFPITPESYILHVFDGACYGSDTALIGSGPDFTLTTVPDDTVCNDSAFQLLVTPSGGGPHTFVWTPSLYLNDSSLANPTANPNSSATFEVAVTNGYCSDTDSVHLTVEGFPVIALAETDITCPNTPVQLDLFLPHNFADDFEGAIDSSYWLSITGATVNSSCGTNSGTGALHFNGSGRVATTVPLVTTGCSELNFCLIFGSGGAPCDNPETGENVVLEYSNDGGNNWNNWATYNESTYTNWTCFTETFPPGANGDSVMIRWRQVFFSGAGADNWALDDISITCAVPVTSPTYSWSPASGLSNPNLPNPIATIGNAATEYTVVVGGNSCPNSGQVTVDVDSINYLVATPDLILCPFDSVQLQAVLNGPGPVSALPCGTTTNPCTGGTEYTLGSSVTTDLVTSPLYGFSSQSRWYNKRQYIYSASELNALGMVSGTINRLSFEASTPGPVNFLNLEVKIGCITDSTYSNTSFFNGLTTVASFPNYSASAGWLDFDFNAGYDWDGVSSLVVEVCCRAGSNGVEVFTTDTSPLDRCLVYTSVSNSNACNRNSGQFRDNRPIIRFRTCPAPALPASYTWTPTLGLSNPNIANPMAAKDNSPLQTYVVTAVGAQCIVTDTVNLTNCGTLSWEDLPFNAQKQDEAVHLSWRTESEQDLAHFEVERSLDGQEFFRIDEVIATGNSDLPQDYRSLDPSPKLGGNNYYRLKIVDRQGQFSYSEVRTVHFDPDPAPFLIYPNPGNSDDQFTLSYPAEADRQLSLEMLDLNGRTIAQIPFQVKAGQNEMSIRLPRLSKGVYLLKVQDRVLRWTKLVISN